MTIQDSRNCSSVIEDSRPWRMCCDKGLPTPHQRDTLSSDCKRLPVGEDRGCWRGRRNKTPGWSLQCRSPFVALFLQPIHATAGVNYRLARSIDGPGDVG